MRIAVDVMGGDRGPEPLIKGCANFIRETQTKIVVVGDERIISRIFKETKTDLNFVEIAHTSQFVNMNDKLSNVLRRKKLASIGIATRLVKSGYCDGLFTIGNTAAAVSWSNVVLKKIKGIKKAALCSALLYPGGYTLLTDAGSSIRCTGESLAQFAIMADVLARFFLGLENPRIGLINIGAEEGKGKFKIQRAHYHLSKLNLNYVGYVEGNDIPSGKIDIAICDGFVGNVLLKYSEGIIKKINKIGNIKKVIRKSYYDIFGDKGKNITSLNGAPLLGVNGPVMIGHGASDEKDFESGLNIAKLFIESNTINKIKERFNNIK